MSNTEEGWHTITDGMQLYTKTWKTEGPPLARVVFVHGFSDHCNAYGILFPSLAKRGIEVFGFDQRGWGRSVKSPRQKGLTGPTSLVLSDIDSVIHRFTTPGINAPAARPPLFLMGHSMGGQEVLTYASVYHPPQIRGYLVESPFIAFSPASTPSALLVLAGRLAAKVLPHRQMVQALDAALLSRDRGRQQECIDDELMHDTGTLEGLAGMLARTEALGSGRVRVDHGLGVWVGHGSADGICDFEASKRWLNESCGVLDRTFQGYDGWFHQLHAEPGDDKVRFANDVAEWILARLS